MEELGMNPDSFNDCERYDSYLMGLVDDQIDFEIGCDDAEFAKEDAEASWLESMAEEQAMFEHAGDVGDISEAEMWAKIDEIEEKVTRFRVERGYDPPPFDHRGVLLRDVGAVLYSRAVHAQRGTTRAHRSVRSTACASRDGPLPDSDDDPHDRVAVPLEREVAA
jgi:hypothetical protein